MHYGCANGFLRLCHTFLKWGFILKHGAYRWSSSPRRRWSCFGHFVFMCNSLTFLFHMDSTSFLSLLANFNKRVMQVCGDIMRPRLWEFFQAPLARHQAWLLIFFSGIGLHFMKDCAPSTFLGNWALVVLYLCSRFRIFDKTHFGRLCFSGWRGPTLASAMLTCNTKWSSSYSYGDAPFFWKSNNYLHLKSTSIFNGHPPQHIP